MDIREKVARALIARGSKPGGSGCNATGCQGDGLDEEVALELADAALEASGHHRMREALDHSIAFIAIHAARYQHDFDLDELHPTHAEMLDRVSELSGGKKLSHNYSRAARSALGEDKT